MIKFFSNLNLNGYENLHTGRWHYVIVEIPKQFNCRSNVKELTK